jgi:hypothetical protein
MMDALMIHGFIASTRHAAYLSIAAAVLGLAEAHYPGLRKAARRAAAWLVHCTGRDDTAARSHSARPRISRNLNGSRP